MGCCRALEVNHQSNGAVTVGEIDGDVGERRKNVRMVAVKAASVLKEVDGANVVVGGTAELREAQQRIEVGWVSVEDRDERILRLEGAALLREEHGVTQPERHVVWSELEGHRERSECVVTHAAGDGVRGMRQQLTEPIRLR